MARKNLLKGLMEDPKTPPARPKKRKIYSKGAIGAVSQSIEALKSRAISDLDPFLIDAGGIADRLEHNDADHKALMESIKNYGQQVPVLVRPHPTAPDRYQIVYGRRRVLAVRDLGLQVKAMIRDLDDTALIMAQGQENSARKDLSFIEKANFARQMQEANYDRKAMCDALHIDKTVISRMLSIVEIIPIEVIEAIGSAPNIGRDRWMGLAKAYQGSGFDPHEAVAMINLVEDKGKSDKLFEGLLQVLSKYDPKSKNAAPEVKKTRSLNKKTLQNADGGMLGVAHWAKGKMTLTLNDKQSDGFDRWLVEHITEIHAGWKANRDE